MTTSSIRSGWSPEISRRPQTGSEKFRSRSGPDESWRKDPLIQHAQDSGRRAPDIALAVRHRVVNPLDAAEFLGMKLVFGRIHQKRQRDFESFVDFRRADAQRESGLYPRDRRQDTKSEAGPVKVEIADRIDEITRQADFLLRLA